MLRCILLNTVIVWSNLFHNRVFSNSGEKIKERIKELIARTPAMKEGVLQEIEQHPEISTRTIGTNYHWTHKLVWVILKEKQFYSYHIHPIEAKLPRNFPLRISFCNWIRGRILAQPEFSVTVPFTYETNFFLRYY